MADLHSSLVKPGPAKQLGVAVVYALMAKLAIASLATTGTLSIVWPLSGVAVSVLLIGGRSYWPAIFAGVFLGDIAAGLPAAAAASIACGNTLEAVLCCWLLGRVRWFDVTLSKPRDYACVIGAAMASAGVSAAVGISALWARGLVTPAQFSKGLVHWWQGDFFGILLVTPLALVWRVRPRGWFHRWRALETAGCFGLAALAGLVAFLDWFQDSLGAIPVDLVILILLAWSAARFGRHGVLLVVAIIAGQGLVGIALKKGYFSRMLPGSGLMDFWLHMIFLAIVGSVIALIIHERQQAQESLRALNATLEERVRARSAAFAESEERYRTLVENATEAIFVFDLDQCRYVDVNGNAVQLFGLSRAQLLGAGPRDLSPVAQPDGAPSDGAVTGYEDVHVADGQSVYEWTHLNARGEEFPCEVRLVKIPSRQRRLVRVSIVDISARKRAEQELRSAVSLLEATLESTTDGILVVDGDQKLVRYNRRFAELWDMPGGIADPARALGKFDLAPDRIKGSFAAAERINSIYADPNAESFDVLEFKDGRICERYSRPQRLGDRVVGRVWSFRDVTARRRSEEQREQAEAQMRQLQKMEAVGRLAGGIAHDFNNILMVIFGNAELAKSDCAEGGSTRAAFDAILGASRQAAEIVRQMLAFSRPQRENLERIALQPVVREVFSFVRAWLPDNVELDLDLPKNPAWVLANSTQVHQVLMNLCTNASHAIGEHRPGRIGIRMESVELDTKTAELTDPNLRAGPYVRLSVADTGIGMDRETSERIFDPFFTTKATGKGTGLGLSVAQGIMRGCRGSISVQTELGRGSTFQLHFPAIGPGSDEAGVAPERATSPVGRGEHILFVDDQGPVSELSQRLLVKLGYRVTSVRSPASALELFSSNPRAVDAVVSDLAMPEMSGAELAALVLAIRPGLPFLLVTGNAGTMTQAEVRAIGIREFLLKPVTMQTYAEALARAFGRE